MTMNSRILTFLFYVISITFSTVIISLETEAKSAGKKDNLLLIAHLGGVVDENIAENSIEGLEEAIARGYTHLEVDARITKDGHVICFHDENLKGETGVDKMISDLTLEEIKKIKLLRNGGEIPTFEEYAALCAGRIDLMVDIKGVDDRRLEEYSRGIEYALRKHGLLKNALILTNRMPIYNQEKVSDWFFGKAKVAWRDPLEIARLRIKAERDPGKYYYIFNHGEDFTREEVEGFHQMGLMVIVSINLKHYKTGDPLQLGLDDLKRVLEYGVDGVQIDSVYDPLILK